MKNKWFEYVINNKSSWGNGWTKIRLEKSKDSVLNDKHIMFDLLERHGGKDMTPEQMEKDNKANFDHCIGNFLCNIHYKMMDLKLIKG